MVKQFLFTVIACVLGFSATAQQHFYVSPKGNDRNPGTKEKPFQTLQILWWNFAFQKVNAAPNQTVQEYQTIAAEEVIAFMKSEVVKPYLKC